jgi:aryl-alcohol dehydrogenase-like predicted oxidoreductase
MQLRSIGRTGLRVSELAFGTMSFGTEADAAESARLYARCRDAGVTHFDTADVYGKGASEQILGQLIRAHREEVFLATKGSFPTGAQPNASGGHRLHLVRACEASLKRLGTDRIDLYYVHRFDPHTPLEETLSALSLLTRQGKIAYAGLSNFAAYQCQRMLDLSGQDRGGHGELRIIAIQPMYNALKRQAEVELLPMAHDNGLGVFPYSPLAAGILTGKFSEPPSGPARLAQNEAYKVRYGRLDLAQVGRAMRALAAENGLHPATLAVAFAASHPDVTAPLLGARDVAQLEPSLAAAGVVLPPALRAALCALVPPPASATDRDDDGSAHDMWKR